MSAGTPYLNPSERLPYGDFIWSPDRRFAFGIARRPPKHLSLYKFVPEDDQVELIVLRDIYKIELSSESYLLMDAESGLLKLFDPPRESIFERGKPRWTSYHPEYPGPHPNAFLVLQPDGNLVIYREGGSTSRHSIWSTDTVQSEAEQGANIAPNVLTINISDGQIASPGSLAIGNDYGSTIAIRDGQSYLQIPAGQSVTIDRLPGTLALESIVYRNPIEGEGSNQFAGRIKVPSDATRVVWDSEGFHVAP